MKKILIIDDDMDMCKLLSHFLERKGFSAETAYSGSKGLAKFNESAYDLVLSDFRLGDKDGRDILQEIKRIRPETPVIIITGYSDIKMAVEVMRFGAFDYITKPLVPEEVISTINRAFENPVRNKLTAEPAGKEIKTNKAHGKGEEQYIAGIAPSIQVVYQQVELVAPTDYSVIIYGESGTGKEVIARTIHEKSKRKDHPFVAVDCGTLSRELAASELFGHIKGSFTGALADKEGMFETAAGGTLFLDEVANLPLDVQITLLRVIQEKKFRRVGSGKDTPSDVRVVVASNESLKEATQKGKFREDLFHRFNEFSLSLPPLRERKEDIPLLASFFLNKVSEELGKKIDGFDEEVMYLFRQYNWPGNLREFRNVIRRAGLLSPSGLVTVNVLPWEIIGTGEHQKDAPPVNMENEELPPIRPVTSLDLKDTAAHAEYETILQVLKQVRFNRSKAAAILKIDRKTLYNKIKAYETANNINVEE